MRFPDVMQRRGAGALIVSVVVALLVAEAAAAAEVTGARFTADGAAVRLVVEVDDPDVGRDDHLELWLALPGERPADALVRDDEGRLLTAGGAADPGAVARELERPRAAVTCDGRPTGRDPDEVAGLLRPPGDRLRRLAATRARHGLVRLALPADGRHATLLDRAAYAGLERAARVKLGPLAAGVSSRVARTATGWRLEARLAPEAFGFVPREGIAAFRAAVVAVDGAPVAAAPRPELEEVRLATPVPVALVPGFAAVGQPGAPAVFPATWMRAPRGWVGLERRDGPLAVDDGRCRVELPRVVETRFVATELRHARSRREGAATIRTFRVARAGEPTALVVADGAGAAEVPLLYDVFALPDGTPAALGATTRVEGNPDGFCGAAPIYELTMWRLDGSPPVRLGALDGCRGDATLAGEPLPRLADSDPTPAQVLSWKTRGRAVTVTLPVLREDDGEEEARRYVLGWDDHGRAPTLRR